MDKIIEELTDPKIDFVIGNDSEEKFNPNTALLMNDEIRLFVLLLIHSSLMEISA